MHWEGPSWWARLTVSWFARHYRIDLNEAELDVSQYKSIGDFFVRRLKPGLRPLANSWAVHPADSEITQAAPIVSGSLIQAKGLNYLLSEFTQDPEASQKWEGGFFITYYLCPTDYHRVHSPVEGVITDARHIPGDLWPVNSWSTRKIKNLFGVNERVLVEIKTDLGPVGVVFVGATNVGHIELAFDKTIHGNQEALKFRHERYTTPVSRGEELGLFRMGSTVVLLYPPHFRQQVEKNLDLRPLVKVNSALLK